MWTDEQEAIFEAEGNLKINAVAGAGKTTTLVEYARRRPDKNFLYLAFNRAIANEAKRKFPENVRCRTAHSIAYAYAKHRGLQVGNISIPDLVEILYDNDVDSYVDVFIKAFLIKKFFSFYCNSAYGRDSEQFELAYNDWVTNHFKKESNLKKLLKKRGTELTEKTMRLFRELENGRIPCSHDFYLKLFQLQVKAGDSYARSLISRYDGIFFDEGQDASPVMLDVFLNGIDGVQKIIVGDSNQQIYAWRYAINALEKVEFKAFNLTNSFRFNNAIAKLSEKLLKTFGRDAVVNGLGGKEKDGSDVLLSRTNAYLLREILKLEEPFYVEGGFSSLMRTQEGISIWDVYNLYAGKKDLIRSPLVRSFPDFESLCEQIQDNPEVFGELETFSEIVKYFSYGLPTAVNIAKSNERQNPSAVDYRFSTTHKAKGLEFDTVYLAEDFLTVDELKDALKRKLIDKEKLSEEVNILYVAITRARKKLVFQNNDEFLEDSLEYFQKEQKIGKSEKDKTTELER